MSGLRCIGCCLIVLGYPYSQELAPVASAAPQERTGAERGEYRVYRQRVAPHWVGGRSQFWYRNDLPGDAREFVFVDPDTAVREPAFDHQAVAQAFGADVVATHLPIESLEYDAEGKLVAFIGKGKRYAWDRSEGRIAETTEDRSSAAARELGRPAIAGSNRTGEESSVTFDNRLEVPIELFWLSGDGSKQSYGKIEPGKSKAQHTFGGHRWEIVNDKQVSLGEIVAEDMPTNVVIDGRKLEVPAAPRRRERERGSGASGRSPDGKWTASIQDFNVVVKATDSGESIVLSHDGKEGLSYGEPTWSPDSLTLIAFRTEAVAKKEVHLIRSSPKEGGRAQLESRPYALPGDPFPKHELNLFRVSSREQIKPIVDRFEHEWSRPRIRFSRDGKRLSYEQTDRGHQRFRLIEVDLDPNGPIGSVRNLVDEPSPTFIWTAHTENQRLSRVHWLNDTDEFLYATEKNGSRQLILIDAVTGEEKRELTPRDIVVRSIESIDESNRRVWFSASGRCDQDPYLIHHGHVELDSGKLVWLTEGNGTHTLQFSPDRKYVIDMYSRVDLGPVTELRRTEDGGLVRVLEQADVTNLKASGWMPPEVFTAKGRDGETDIWGIICRPRDFDANKKYPVIEDIYAGPHSSFVPKSFSPSMRYDSLTRLGFIVVKIDGMGTANRSKAFHDVCWKNLKDGGFADRIAWMKAAAAKHPEMDLSRVGIYGTSAGGQNAAGAVLFHPEFYHVAVAASGCHDNRMDKASWNEQWMGYPVGPEYSECSNIDNAHRLRGKLLLIVGEMDTNVPPESTMRFADALIRANKDFDLLVVPNAGHGMGGAYGQRRMHDYFVRHLLRQEPPDRNAAQNQPEAQARGVRIPAQSAGEAPTVRMGARPTAAAGEPITNPGRLAVLPPPAEFFELVRERHRPAARDFYKKYLDVGGLPVVAADVVADEALLRTHEIVTHMLAGRKDVLQAMKQTGMYLIIIGKDQVYTDMPEYRDHPNPAFQNERVRGTGGKPTSFGEENLLSLSLDRYDDESIGVHEFCHTIDGALRSLDAGWSERLREAYQAARRRHLYDLAYAGSNAGEYWAEICQSYFDCNRVNNWNHGPVGTREQLKVHDPIGYELVRSTFRLTPEQDWRYSFHRKLPLVETPPEKLKVDPYYTKFCWARELIVVGREASDDALLKANDIVRKMFAYRHDILKALIAEDVRLVVLGRNESLGDLPEFSDAEARDDTDLLARYLEYSLKVKRLVVAEENVLRGLGAGEDVGVGDSQTIRVLADAIYKIAARRPVDPKWEDRPRNVWQQYELRVDRIDQRLDERLTECFDRAMKSGKWVGTAVCDGASYWVTGVLAYFNAVGQSTSPTDSVHPIRTREQLAQYDPDLYDLVHKTFAYDRRVDWRLSK